MNLNRPARLAALAALVMGFAVATAIADDAAPAAPAAPAAAAAPAATSDAGDPTQSPAIELSTATQPANIARGKLVFQTTANCVNCHGWPGDGSTGKNPRSPGIAANLRQSQLDTNTMIQVVSCGIPGSAMPYHDAQAYKDPRCYGQLLKDFSADQQPNPGHFINAQDIINVVAYVQQKVKGRGAITKAECEEYFNRPGAAACKDYQ